MGVGYEHIFPDQAGMLLCKTSVLFPDSLRFNLSLFSLLMLARVWYNVGG